MNAMKNIQPEQKKWLFYFTPRVGDFLFSAMFLLVIAFGPRLLNVDGDLGRHITIGRYILQEKYIPTRDVFSHTMYGEHLTPHEWLTQVIFGWLYSVSGLNGIVVVCALIIAFSMMIVYRTTMEKSESVIVATLLVLLVAAASSIHWLARPHLFTLLFTAVWFWYLDHIRQNKRLPWWGLPVLMLLWVNLHGAFIVGFVVLFIYVIGTILDVVSGRVSYFSIKTILSNYIKGGVVSLLASFVNPTGLGIWKTSIGYLQNRYLVDHTAEYMSPNLHDPQFYPFLMLLLLMIVLLGISPNAKRPWSDVLIAGGWSVMALYSIRNIPLYAVLIAPLLGEWIREYSISQTRIRTILYREGIYRLEHKFKGFVFPLMVIGLTILGLSSGFILDVSQTGYHFSRSVFPVDAVDWIEEHPMQGHMFNHFPWGGYLLFRLYPNYLVFIDGQTDFYGEALTREYEQVITLSKGWEDILHKYDVSWIIIPQDSTLALELFKRSDWKAVYTDDLTVIFAR